MMQLGLNPCAFKVSILPRTFPFVMSITVMDPSLMPSKLSRLFWTNRYRSSGDRTLWWAPGAAGMAWRNFGCRGSVLSYRLTNPGLAVATYKRSPLALESIYFDTPC